MSQENHTKENCSKAMRPKRGHKRTHVGAKIAKILLPLIAAALSLADAIECILWGVSTISSLLLIASTTCFGIAAWLFLGFELALYYDKHEKKLMHSDINELEQRARNRGGWLLLLSGALLFSCAVYAGNMVPLAMFYALLMT